MGGGLNTMPSEPGSDPDDRLGVRAAPRPSARLRALPPPRADLRGSPRNRADAECPAALTTRSSSAQAAVRDAHRDAEQAQEAARSRGRRAKAVEAEVTRLRTENTDQAREIARLDRQVTDLYNGMVDVNNHLAAFDCWPPMSAAFRLDDPRAPAPRRPGITSHWLRHREVLAHLRVDPKTLRARMAENPAHIAPP